MPAARIPRLTGEIVDLLDEISGRNFSEEAPESTFVDLGLDSLLLSQVALAASKRFGTPLKLRHFLDECPSIATLAALLDNQLPPTAYADAPLSVTGMRQVVTMMAPAALSNSTLTSSAPAPEPPSTVRNRGSTRAPGNLEALVRQQLEVMSRQLELLSATRNADTVHSAIEAFVTAPAAGQSPEALLPRDASSPVSDTCTTESGSAQRATQAPPIDKECAPSLGPDGRPVRHGPQLVIDRNQGKELAPTQEKHLKKLIERYTAKTQKSKAFTQRNRAQIADPRVVAGFRPKLKELVYPIVVERSLGCRLWDVDGNEYIDLLNGYGSNFFGYGAEFVRKAMHEQLDRGMDIGPQSPLVEEVASLFREFVPMDRVAFCNTGSEAVLATLRMARTVTGRDRVVMFSGGYHGIFDEVVVRGTPRGKSMPAAPGIPSSAVENIVVLDWGSPQALEFVKARGPEIAAVIVEPVQSRRPELQPKAFLQELRRLTEASGTALIFDEVVTGFRIGPGGGQEYYGITADLASYGKVLGGGISIGIVAGKRAFMDSLDGGPWQFGDASVPEVGVTYFAGTFVRHPLALAAARAVLLHMKSEGPELQARVNRTTDEFVSQLNSFFKQEGAPVELRNFCSIMKIAHTGEVPYSEILFAHLRERGVHAWEGRPCYMTAAHRAEDLAQVVEAFKQSVAELQENGFYPQSARQARRDLPPVPGARLGRDPQGNPAWFAPDPENPTRYRQVARAL